MTLSVLKSFKCSKCSKTVGRPLRSLDRHDLLVPRSRTATAQHRAFASVCPLLWNGVPTIIRAQILSEGFSFSAGSLKTFLFQKVFALGAPLFMLCCERRLIKSQNIID